MSKRRSKEQREGHRGSAVVSSITRGPGYTEYNEECQRTEVLSHSGLELISGRRKESETESERVVWRGEQRVCKPR